jgi:hypothetical protein
VPTGIDGRQPGYALFTWDSIGIIDVPSMIAITSEAWFRQPTTMVPVFVSVYNDQVHFTYCDGGGNLQDCCYNGPAGTWNLQQINNANGPAPPCPASTSRSRRPPHAPREIGGLRQVPTPRSNRAIHSPGCGHRIWQQRQRGQVPGRPALRAAGGSPR